MADLSTYLQANPQMPLLTDPSCPTENFNHRCNQEQYTNLRKWIKYYSEKATAALQETDAETSRKLWREIFGDDYGTSAKAVTKAAQAHVGRARDTEQFLERDLGIPIRLNRRCQLRVNACVIPRDGFRTYDLSAHGGVVGKYRDIRFTVAQCAVPRPYKIYWKVRNTGDEAIRADCIRGQIVADNGTGTKNEPTRYRGKHYVECYVVKDGICVAMAHQVVVIK